MNKKAKQFLVQKFTKKWLEDNKGMMDDYQKLCVDLMRFRLFWGIEIGFMLKNPKEIEGRELGKGFAEELKS